MYQTINKVRRKAKAKDVREFHNDLNSLLISAKEFGLVDVLIQKLKDGGHLDGFIESIKEKVFSDLNLPAITSLGQQLDFESLIKGA